MMDELKIALARDLDGSFPTLVMAMSGDLYSGLRRMSGDPVEAEDLTQETFVRAYRALRGYERNRILDLSLRGWLWTIALNLGRNHLRDRARRPQLINHDEPQTVDAEPPDTAAWDRRLAALTGPQRNAVVLRHVAGMGISEIAEATGRPQGTVKADIHRGLAKLRQSMEAE